MGQLAHFRLSLRQLYPTVPRVHCHPFGTNELWGKEKYHVAVSPRRLGRCLGMSPPLSRRGLCSVLDLPECHPQDDYVVLFQTRPLVRLGAGALHFTDLDSCTHGNWVPTLLADSPLKLAMGQNAISSCPIPSYPPGLSQLHF